MKKAVTTPFFRILILLTFLTFSKELYAQTEYTFPKGDFWSLDAGLGMSNILVQGASFQLIVDPKLWLSPKLMVGSMVGLNYSTDAILTFNGQVYLRWNFLELGKTENPINVFLQGGLGLLASYRGWDNPFDDVTRTRGSLMVDAAGGVTIPLTPRWHIEPEIHGGYPHMFGVSVTAGYKFPLPQKTITNTVTNTVTGTVVHTDYQFVPGETQYVETIRTLPPEEIIKRVMITSVEYVMFGPDIGRYNIGVDKDAQQLNELVLNQAAQMLKDNPNLRVRIEGHANPYTISHSEVDELMVLSAMRADAVAEQLKQKGIPEDQIVVVSFGGTRTATNEWDLRNRNRRVELMLIQVDLN